MVSRLNGCHSERSEESLRFQVEEILLSVAGLLEDRSAPQNDTDGDDLRVSSLIPAATTERS